MVMAAHQQVFVVPQTRVVAVLDPLLLHKFKLAEQAGPQRHENDPMLVRIARGLVRRRVFAISQAAPHDPAAVDQPAVESERVPRIRATDVTADGTARAVRIVPVCEVGITRLVLHQIRVLAIRRQFQGVPSVHLPTNLAASFSSPPGYCLPFSWRYSRKLATFSCSFRYAIYVPLIPRM